MSTTYYNTTDAEYPPIIISLMESLRYYYCSLLYPDESYDDSKKRFVRAGISNFGLRESAKVFKVTNYTLPITSFGYAELSIYEDTFNKYASTRNFYDSYLDCKVEAKPMILEIPMISFFSTGYDYFRAVQLLLSTKKNKVKVNSPITINGTVTSIPITLRLDDVSKGSYAWEFQEQLITGKIQDINHTTYVHYYDIITSADLAPVDDIEMNFNVFNVSAGDGVQVDSGGWNIPTTFPEVSSTSPADEDTDVGVDLSWTINFNTPMNEDSVESKIDVDPYVEVDYVWNATSDSVIIDPWEDLLSGTLYTVTVGRLCTSSFGIVMDEDYEFEFTTEE